jgi:MFS family permease
VDTKNYSEAFKICKNYLSNFEETQENFSNIMESNDINYENEITRIQEEDKKDSSFFNYSAIMVFALFNSFLVQGIRYILPKTLTHFYHLKLYNLKEEHFKAGYSHNAAVVSAELQISSTLSAFISFLTGILIENSFFKRLRLLRIGIFLCTILSFLAYFLRNKIDVFACSLKSLITLQDQILDIYSSETFDTKRRIMLLSTYNIIQSISSFMSPYVNDLITNYWFRLNYLIFFIILCFLFLLSFGLGKEKIKKILI